MHVTTDVPYAALLPYKFQKEVQPKKLLTLDFYWFVPVFANEKMRWMSKDESSVIYKTPCGAMSLSQVFSANLTKMCSSWYV